MGIGIAVASKGLDPSIANALILKVLEVAADELENVAYERCGMSVGRVSLHVVWRTLLPVVFLGAGGLGLLLSAIKIDCL